MWLSSGWTALEGQWCLCTEDIRPVCAPVSNSVPEIPSAWTALLHSVGNRVPHPIFSGCSCSRDTRDCYSFAFVEALQGGFCRCSATADLKAAVAKPLLINLFLALVPAAVTRWCIAHALLIFFFCWLKLSMMTPMKRFNVKKDPKIMKITK